MITFGGEVERGLIKRIFLNLFFTEAYFSFLEMKIKRICDDLFGGGLAAWKLENIKICVYGCGVCRSFVKNFKNSTSLRVIFRTKTIIILFFSYEK
jgi:hypothetical protein